MSTIIGTALSPTPKICRRTNGVWTDYPSQPALSGLNPGLAAARIGNDDFIVCHDPVAHLFWHLESGTWVSYASAAGHTIYDIFILSLDPLIMYATSQTAVWKFSGGAWSIIYASLNNTTYSTAVWAASENAVFVSAGTGGAEQMLVWDGATWTNVYPGSAGIPSSVWGYAANEVYFGATTSIIKWNGVSTSVELAPTKGAMSVWGYPPVALYCAGTALFQSQPAIDGRHAGPSWVNEYLGFNGENDSAFSLHGVSADEVYYAELRYGTSNASYFWIRSAIGAWSYDTPNDAYLAANGIVKIRALPSTVALTSIDPELIGNSGGEQIAVAGTFPVNLGLTAYLGPNGDDTDPPCYGGEGFGYSPQSADGASLVVVAPPVDAGAAYLTVVDPQTGDSSALPITVVESPDHSKVFAMRSSWPGWVGLGKRSIDG
jgi:hypothetical protein